MTKVNLPRYRHIVIDSFLLRDSANILRRSLQTVRDIHAIMANLHIGTKIPKEK